MKRHTGRVPKRAWLIPPILVIGIVDMLLAVKVAL